MSTYRLHARTQPRRISEVVAANRAAVREAKRQHDRQELEREWRELTAPSPRCVRCANLAPGTRCAGCLAFDLLPRLRP